jgi:hypothetical protein
MLVKCEVKSCKYNIYRPNGFICNKHEITIGYGNKNGEWVFAECMDYVKKEDERNEDKTT